MIVLTRDGARETQASRARMPGGIRRTLLESVAWPTDPQDLPAASTRTEIAVRKTVRNTRCRSSTTTTHRAGYARGRRDPGRARPAGDSRARETGAPWPTVRRPQ